MIYVPADGGGQGQGGGVYAPPSGPCDLLVDSVPDCEGRRGVGREGGGRGGRRVVEVVRGPVGKRRSIMTTVPAQTSALARASISLCSWSIL